jgi:hypothetical protein
MRHRSNSQPYCINCGDRIRKYTTAHHFSTLGMKDTEFSKTHPLPNPKTKAECQRLTNQQVVSLRYSQNYDDGKPVGKRWVYSFTSWDGETYEDAFFCSGTCATDFAYACARAGMKRQRNAA